MSAMNESGRRGRGFGKGRGACGSGASGQERGRGVCARRRGGDERERLERRAGCLEQRLAEVRARLASLYGAAPEQEPPRA